MVARFGTHVILGVHAVLLGELLVLFLFDGLHVHQVGLVAHQDQEGQVLALKRFPDQVQPVVQVLERRLIGDVID